MTSKQLTNSKDSQGYEETKLLSVVLDDSKQLEIYDYSLSSVINDPNVNFLFGIFF